MYDAVFLNSHIEQRLYKENVLPLKIIILMNKINKLNLKSRKTKIILLKKQLLFYVYTYIIYILK